MDWTDGWTDRTAVGMMVDVIPEDGRNDDGWKEVFTNNVGGTDGYTVDVGMNEGRWTDGTG